MSEDIAQLSFEEALKELDNIVKQLESGKETLEAAIEKYERGNALRAHCEKKLKEARLRVEQITVTAEGTLTAVPMATDE